jgi:hypothetical protein
MSSGGGSEPTRSLPRHQAHRISQNSAGAATRLKWGGGHHAARPARHPPSPTPRTRQPQPSGCGPSRREVSRHSTVGLSITDHALMIPLRASTAVRSAGACPAARAGQCTGQRRCGCSSLSPGLCSALPSAASEARSPQVSRRLRRRVSHGQAAPGRAGSSCAIHKAWPTPRLQPEPRVGHTASLAAGPPSARTWTSWPSKALLATGSSADQL